MKTFRNTSSTFPADSRIVKDKLEKAAFAPSVSCLAMLLAIFVMSVGTFYGALRHFGEDGSYIGSQLESLYQHHEQDIAGTRGGHGGIRVSHIPGAGGAGAGSIAGAGAGADISGGEPSQIPFDADTWPLYEPPPVLFQQRRPSTQAPPTSTAGSPVPSKQFQNTDTIPTSIRYDRGGRRMFSDNNRRVVMQERASFEVVDPVVPSADILDSELTVSPATGASYAGSCPFIVPGLENNADSPSSPFPSCGGTGGDDEPSYSISSSFLLPPQASASAVEDDEELPLSRTEDTTTSAATQFSDEYTAGPGPELKSSSSVEDDDGSAVAGERSASGGYWGQLERAEREKEGSAMVRDEAEAGRLDAAAASDPKDGAATTNGGDIGQQEGGGGQGGGAVDPPNDDPADEVKEDEEEFIPSYGEGLEEQYGDPFLTENQQQQPHRRHIEGLDLTRDDERCVGEFCRYPWPNDEEELARERWREREKRERKDMEAEAAAAAAATTENDDANEGERGRSVSVEEEEAEVARERSMDESDSRREERTNQDQRERHHPHGHLEPQQDQPHHAHTHIHIHTHAHKPEEEEALLEVKPEGIKEEGVEAGAEVEKEKEEQERKIEESFDVAFEPVIVDKKPEAAEEEEIDLDVEDEGEEKEGEKEGESSGSVDSDRKNDDEGL